MPECSNDVERRSHKNVTMNFYRIVNTAKLTVCDIAIHEMMINSKKMQSMFSLCVMANLTE